MLEEEQETNYLNPNNQDNNNLSLPTPEELIPLSQTLIPTNLALAFDILTDPSSKRPRLVWTPHLHRRFVDSVSQLGIKHAVPKAIMQLMGVEGLSRENVASHLQKYRQYLKRIGSGLGGGGGDPAMDRLFSSSPVPALFLQQFNSSRDNNNSNSNNLSPFSAVGAVGELVFRPEGFRGVGANGSVSNLVSEHSFLMGQSQQRSTSDKHDNLSPFTAVGVVGELGSGTKGFRGVVANGSGSDRPSDHSFLMAQMQSGGDRRDDLSPFSAVGLRENGPVSNLVSEHSFFVGQSRQSSSTNRENVLPFSTLGPVQELGFRPEGSRRVAVNGSVSNLVFEHSFLMGQSQQSSCGNKEKMSPFSAVGTVRELGFGTEGFQGVGENGLVSNLGSERSFFMGQSQQSSTNRENLLPFSAVQPEIGFRPEGFRWMGAIGPGSYRLCDGSLQMGRSQMYGSSPMYVDEMASGDLVGGRRVLALFPTREDD